MAMDIHFDLRKDAETIYKDGHVALERGRTNNALRLFRYCIAQFGHRDALKDAFDIITRQRPVCDEQVYGLESAMTIRFKSLLDQSSFELRNKLVNKIDLTMLGDYFGRIYDETDSQMAGARKALTLFYEHGPNTAVSEAAIEVIESFVVFHESSLLRLYLAIAYQSRFHESQNQLYQELAVKCFAGLAGDALYAVDYEPFILNIGYLLEKGFFVGRDGYRKNAMIEWFCDNRNYGDKEILRVMFDQLFTKPSCDERIEGVSEHGRVFGMGRHAKDALQLYSSMSLWYRYICNNRIGLLYHKGGQGVQSDTSKAEEYYSVAIANQSTDALCNMGVLKFGATGDDSGISYLNCAVKAGSSTGMNNLAVALQLGDGVNRDVFRTAELFKQAIATDNNPVAMYNLAVLYMWGDPEVRTDENISESQRLISDLTSPDVELAPLYILKEQVRRFAELHNSREEIVMWKTVELEELDECLAFVKILETSPENEMSSGEDCVEIRHQL